MARTITEIQNQIKTTWINSHAMRTLFGLGTPTAGQEVLQFDIAFPATSIESRLVWIVASAIAILENIFDWHKEDISKIVNNERYGYAGWYKKMALLFRSGENINYDYSGIGDFAETTLYPSINPETNLEYTDAELAELQIVKYAFAEDTGAFVLLKVAGANPDGSFSVLGNSELTALQAYINRIKPAGIAVNVISSQGEGIWLQMQIIYNPILFNENGQRLSDNSYPIKDAINAYITSLDFNGTFYTDKCVDAIQQIEGIEHCEITYATTTTTNATSFNIAFTPYSGYIRRINNTDLSITYTPNV